MSKATINSDSDCCYICTRHYYDMDQRSLICRATGQKIHEWNPACKEHFERRLQGFGE